MSSNVLSRLDTLQQLARLFMVQIDGEPVDLRKEGCVTVVKSDLRPDRYIVNNSVVIQSGIDTTSALRRALLREEVAVPKRLERTVSNLRSVCMSVLGVPCRGPRAEDQTPRTSVTNPSVPVVHLYISSDRKEVFAFVFCDPKSAFAVFNEDCRQEFILSRLSSLLYLPMVPDNKFIVQANERCARMLDIFAEPGVAEKWPVEEKAMRALSHQFNEIPIMDACKLPLVSLVNAWRDRKQKSPVFPLPWSPLKQKENLNWMKYQPLTSIFDTIVLGEHPTPWIFEPGYAFLPELDRKVCTLGVFLRVEGTVHYHVLVFQRPRGHSTHCPVLLVNLLAFNTHFQPLTVVQTHEYLVNPISVAVNSARVSQS